MSQQTTSTSPAVTVKLVFQSEIRRLTVDESKINLTDLTATAKNLFSSLPASFAFKYRDDEGDEITVSSDAEFNEALRLLKSTGSNTLRLQITEVKVANANNNNNNQAPNEQKVEITVDVPEGTEKFLGDLLNGVNLNLNQLGPFLTQFSQNQGQNLCSMISQLGQNFASQHGQNRGGNHGQCWKRYYQQKMQAQNNNNNNNNNATEQPQQAFHPARCDGCKVRIAYPGKRYKCNQCPDFDLCEKCFSTASNLDSHNPSHHFVSIESPQTPIHQASCDLCDSIIVGTRMKCLQCPDFDFCDKCFQTKRNQHPTQHQFVKIERPARYPWWRHCRQGYGNFVNNNESCQKSDEKCKEKCEENESCQKSASTNGLPPQCHGNFRGRNWKKYYQQKMQENVNVNNATTPSNVEKKDEKKTEMPATIPLTPLRIVPSKVEEKKVEEKKVETPVPSAPLYPSLNENKVEEKKVEEKKVEEKKAVHPFEAKLQQMAELGFHDRSKNVSLLVKYNGDMLQAIQELLN